MTLDDPDPEWIIDLAHAFNMLEKDLSLGDKKVIRDLFLDYKRDGLNSECALKKAIGVFNHFIPNSD